MSDSLEKFLDRTLGKAETAAPLPMHLFAAVRTPGRESAPINGMQMQSEGLDVNIEIGERWNASSNDLEAQPDRLQAKEKGFDDLPGVERRAAKGTGKFMERQANSRPVQIEESPIFPTRFPEKEPSRFPTQASIYSRLTDTAASLEQRLNQAKADFEHIQRSLKSNDASGHAVSSPFIAQSKNTQERGSLLSPGNTTARESPEQRGAPASLLAGLGSVSLGRRDDPSAVETRTRDQMSQLGSPDNESAPTIEIRIGRIEVRAVTAPVPAHPVKPSPPTPRLSLDDYLRARSERRS